MQLRYVGVVVLSAAATVWAGPVYEARFVFEPEKIHNHSSSIVECPNGDLLLCWYRGHGERTSDDVAIMGSRLRQGESKWCEPFVMADTLGFPDCNPILYVAPDEKLWLIWPVILNNEWGSALLKFRESTDYGKAGPPRWTWQENIILKQEGFAEDLAEGIKKFEGSRKANKRYDDYFTKLEEASKDKLTVRSGWMPRTHPTLLSSGRILLGLYSDVFSISLMAITDDNGKTWRASKLLVGGGNIQPSVVQRQDGSLVAFHRENGITGRVRVCESTDDGETWGEVTSMDMANSGSSVEVIALRSGKWLMANNDTMRGRHRLTVSLSDDEGKTWKWSRPLENDEPGKGSYSYPSVMQTEDGKLHCTYSYSKDGVQCIKHVAFNEAWVAAQAEAAE